MKSIELREICPHSQYALTPQAKMKIQPFSVAFCFASVAILSSSMTQAQTTANQPGKAEIRKILSWAPSHEVEYDFAIEKGSQPPAAMVDKCQIQRANSWNGKKGFVVADNTNRVLRVLLDLDKDKKQKLDFWSYYKDGVEVYREVDEDFNGKPDQFRWLGTAGTRWGVDSNQDGEIDEWKHISAEEVAFEVFMAIKTRDDERYRRLLITGDEFKSLGLSGKIADDAKQRLAKAQSGFANMVRGQKAINASSKWINSGNGQPSMAPKGDEMAKDLIVHDHASSVFQSKSGTNTLALGTLVKIGNVWRLMELPQVVSGTIDNGGLLFPVAQIDPMGDNVAVDPKGEKMAKLFASLTDLEGQIGEATPGAEMVKLQEKRALLQWDIYRTCPEGEKLTWLENIGDTVSNAYQEELYPEGLTFLERILKTLEKYKKTERMDYIRWRMIHAEYWRGLDDDARGKAAATEKYYEQLPKFINDYSKSKFAPEGMFNIGQNFETNRNRDVDKAKQWYKNCATNYPNTIQGKRAKGAYTRLTGIGTKVGFKGATEDGKQLDLGNPQLRGRIVVVYFWHTWCADQSVNAKGETAFEVFADLNSKYKNSVVFVSANVEENTETYKDKFSGDLKGMIRMHSPGGNEKSELAIQLGVVTAPMMAVWDEDGKLVDCESGAGDLDRMIQRLQKGKPAAKQARAGE